MARPHAIRKRQTDLSKFRSVVEYQPLFVEQFAVPARHPVAAPGQRVIENSLGGLLFGVDVGQRVAVRCFQIGFKLFRVALAAGAAAHVSRLTAPFGSRDGLTLGAG